MSSSTHADIAWPPTRLTVVYDDTCELCRRCRQWLATQPTLVDLGFLASSDPSARLRYGHLPWYKVELMVVADSGHAWIGPEAFLMCLWATRRWRATSFRLNGTAFAPVAERFFHALSSNRSVVSGMLDPHRCNDDTCGRVPA
ncbi:MAG: DCC1-like thiol-disulfide oxidoreductase family protein [Acidimicrobiales bacterium]